MVLAQLYSHAGTSSKWSLGFHGHAGRQSADTESTSWYFSTKSTTPRALRPGQGASVDSAGSPSQRSIGREEPLEHLVSATILHSQRPFVGLASNSKDYPVESPDEFPKDFDAEVWPVGMIRRLARAPVRIACCSGGKHCVITCNACTGSCQKVAGMQYLRIILPVSWCRQQKKPRTAIIVMFDALCKFNLLDPAANTQASPEQLPGCMARRHTWPTIQRSCEALMTT